MVRQGVCCHSAWICIQPDRSRPDTIPVLGYVDDLVLVPVGISLALIMVPKMNLDECTQKAREAAAKGKATNWVAGGVIIAICTLCIALVVAALTRLVKT